MKGLVGSDASALFDWDALCVEHDVAGNALDCVEGFEDLVDVEILHDWWLGLSLLCALP